MLLKTSEISISSKLTVINFLLLSVESCSFLSFSTILSLDFEKKEVEIAYFGILEEYFGKKCGGYLLSEAIKKLFEQGMSRVWLHTCSLDHKNAIKNYLARGMQVFKSEKINVDLN